MAKIKNKVTKYLCVDTNIFIQCCLLEVDGDDIDVIKKLKGLLDTDKVKLLLPEVIELEFKKVLSEKMDGLAMAIGKHKGAINMDNFDEKIKKDLISGLQKVIDERKENTEKVKRQIEDIFSHKNTVRTELQLKPETFVNAFKRHLSNKKPMSKEVKDTFQRDCLIIESLKMYLNLQKDHEFYFCSQNVNDFSQKKNNKEFEIHVDLKNDFKHIVFNENLGTLLNKVFKTKVSPETIKKLDEEKKIIELLFKNYSTPVTSILTNPSFGSGEKLENGNEGVPE